MEHKQRGNNPYIKVVNYYRVTSDHDIHNWRFLRKWFVRIWFVNDTRPDSMTQLQENVAALHVHIAFLNTHRLKKEEISCLARTADPNYHMQNIVEAERWFKGATAILHSAYWQIFLRGRFWEFLGKFGKFANVVWIWKKKENCVSVIQ